MLVSGMTLNGVRRFSQSSISVSSTSVDSTNCVLKILGKRPRKFQNTKLEFAPLPTVYTAFTTIYKVLGIISG